MHGTWRCCRTPIATEQQSGLAGLVAWLVAKPLNGVIALALTVLLGIFSFTSAIVVTILALAKGLRDTVILLGGALAITIAVGFAAGIPMDTVIPGAIAIWLPPMLLVTLLVTTRSLTLTLQLSALIAVLAISGIFLIAGNPVDYWIAQFDEVAATLREGDMAVWADWVEAQKANAGQMTMVAVFANWSVHTASFVLGYRLYRRLPDAAPKFGHFRDLNFGKVLAIVVAVSSLGSMLIEAQWLQNIAFILFAVFWMQGLAIVHWLHAEGMLPRIGLVTAYTLLLSFILTAATMVGLAIFGYLDAWFRLRRRPQAA